MPSDFVHLHVHSHYSLLDGLGKIDELIARAKELDMPALALTDHGNMHGAIEFYTKCQKAGIKPILGVEAYLAPRKMEDKVPKVDSRAYHQLLLAKNDIGYKNLLFLVSQAHTKGMYYKPRIDLDLLARHAKGLIGTSSCLAGMIPEAIAGGDLDKAIELTRRFRDIFDGDFFLELQHHPSLDRQAKVNDGLKTIAQELKIGLIATSDVHYVHPQDKQTHEILLAINSGGDITRDDRMSFGDVDVSMHDENFFKTAFADVPEVITNTKKIADSVELEIPLGENILPNFAVPNGLSADAYLETLCRQGIANRYPTADATKLKTIEDRLTWELDTIKNMGFASYFLIVADFVSWAKSQGILVGPGRGSAAGSIMAYLTGITNIDPLEYGFLFERFLNPDRISMPDMDIDFADDRRDEVIAYVTQKYGSDHVAGVATFGTMMGRAAVRDVARVLNVPYGEADALAKLIPAPIQGRHVPLADSINKVSELKAQYDSNPTIRRVLDFAVKLEGTVRHASQHACAFVICKEPTVNYTAVMPAQRGREGVVTQTPNTEDAGFPIEKIGLLKMDFLGLSNLTIIKNCLRIVRKIYNVDIDLDRLPLDDTKTYELLSRGDTLGVFQLESSGMQRYIKELKPDRFEDIIAMVSLYRPGPMANIPSFIARKHGRQEVAYLHPKLENALATTYGIPVYQEQVMQATKDLAGFSGGEADTVRKAMGKKIAALMGEMKEKFIAGCQSHSNIEKPLAEKIWKEFEEFAAYGFNKSHAGCYALIAYQTAYLKAHYPAAFFAALLTSNADNLDKMAVEMSEAEKMGIKILPPDINESFPEFGVIHRQTAVSRQQSELNAQDSMPKSDYIRFGLAAIKNVGAGVAQKIVEERQAGGPYKTLSEFLHRLGPSVLNKRVLEALAMTGALDSFGERNALVGSVETMVRFLANGKKASDQMGLFGAETVALAAEMALADAPPVERRVALEWEKQLLGIYLSGHPLKEIEAILPHIARPIGDITTLMEGQNQRVGGIVSDVRTITTKSNEAMAFVKLTDTTGTIEVVVFPRVWSDVKLFCAVDRYLVVLGRVDSRDNAAKIIASRIVEIHPEEDVGALKATLGPIPKSSGLRNQRSGQTGQRVKPKSPTQSSARLLLKMPTAMSKKALEEIRYILEAHAGEIPVYIETVRDGDYAIAKTKSAVTPDPDLLIHLNRAGVETRLEGTQTVQPDVANSTDDIAPPVYENEFIADPELALAD